MQREKQGPVEPHDFYADRSVVPNLSVEKHSSSGEGIERGVGAYGGGKAGANIATTWECCTR